MQELKVITDLSVMPAVIDTNYEEVEAGLVEALKKYDGLVVTPENFKSMKNTRAEINSGIKVFYDCDRQVKAKFTAPYQTFHEKIKKLVTIAEEKRDALDVQIKDMEQKLREDKRVELEAFVRETVAASGIAPEYANAPHFSKMVEFHYEWLNATYSPKKAKAEIEAEVKRSKVAVAQIVNLYARDTEVVQLKAQKAIVETAFDLGTAIEIVDAFKEQEAQFAEARARDEEARRQREAEEQAKAEAEKAEEPENGVAEAPEAPAEAPNSAEDAAKAVLRALREARAGGTKHSTPASPSAHSPVLDASADTPDSPDLKPSVYRMAIELTANCDALRKVRAFLDANGIAFKLLSKPEKVG